MQNNPATMSHTAHCNKAATAVLNKSDTHTVVHKSACTANNKTKICTEESPRFINLWCKCARSGEKKLRCSRLRRIIAVTVSSTGMQVNRTIENALFISNDEPERYKGSAAIIKPKNWLPPSPIKIEAFGLL